MDWHGHNEGGTKGSDSGDALKVDAAGLAGGLEMGGREEERGQEDSKVPCLCDGLCDERCGGVIY